MRKTYTIKRLRKQYDGKEAWVSIGACVVNDSDGTGSVYLNHINETWRLFEKKPKKHAEEDQS